MWKHWSVVISNSKIHLSAAVLAVQAFGQHCSAAVLVSAGLGQHCSAAVLAVQAI